jgi:hypothetical protein
MTTKRQTPQSGFLLWFAMVVVFACTMGLILSGGVNIVVEFLGDAIDGETTYTEHQLDKSLSREQREEIIGRLEE